MLYWTMNESVVMSIHQPHSKGNLEFYFMSSEKNAQLQFMHATSCWSGSSCSTGRLNGESAHSDKRSEV